MQDNKINNQSIPTQSNMMFVTSFAPESNVYPFSQHLLHSTSTLGYNGNYISSNIYIPEYNSQNLPSYSQHYSLPSIYDSTKYSTTDYIPKNLHNNEKQDNFNNSYYDNGHVDFKDEFIYQMPARSLYNNSSQYSFINGRSPNSELNQKSIQSLHCTLPSFTVSTAHISPRINGQPLPQKLHTSIPIVEDEQKHKKKRKSDWSSEEDHLLGQLVNEYSEEKRSLRAHWKEISQKLNTNKTPVQCSQRWKRVLDPKLIKGSWTVDEEDQLLNLVDDQGMSWAQVAKVLGDRSDGQCRYWYMKIQNSHQVEWSEEEDQALRELVRVMNTDWEQIYKEMLQKKLSKSTRSPREYKMRWIVLSTINQKETIIDQYTIPQNHITNIISSTNNNNNIISSQTSLPPTELPPLATVLRGLANSNLRN